MRLVTREDFGPYCVDLERLAPDGSLARVVMRYENPFGRADYEVRTVALRGDDNLIVEDYLTRVVWRNGEYGVNVTGVGPWISTAWGTVVADNLAAAVRLASELNSGVHA